jgi:hypothetical protein
MSENKFDASKHLTKLKGKDYLEVKFRLQWLRTEQPDAVIDTKLMEHTFGEFALFKATVSIPEKGMATGWGSETPRDFNDYIEKAETKAIGRALAALGYGTQFCEDHDFGNGAQTAEPKVVDSPVERRPQTPVQTQAQPVAQSQPMRGTGITEKQMAFIHQLATDRGKTHEDLNAMASATYGCPVKGLNSRQASEFIDAVRQLPIPRKPAPVAQPSDEEPPLPEYE